MFIMDKPFNLPFILKVKRLGKSELWASSFSLVLQNTKQHPYRSKINSLLGFNITDFS